MQREIPVDIDSAELEAATGSAAYERGARYARDGYVQTARWKPSVSALVGTVRGSGGAQYTTTAAFFWSAGILVFDHGECSCPVGFDCKHVVALVLAATSSTSGVTTRGTRNPPSHWDRSLSQSLDTSERARHGEHTPLALELTLSQAPRASARHVFARLVRPGKRGGWVAGDLSWNNAEMLRYYGDYDPHQVRLVQELFALSGAGGALRYSSYGETKTIDLSAFPSRRLWAVLADAERAGLGLVHAKRAHGPIESIVSAEVCLDVTRRSGEDKLVIAPQIRVAAEDLHPVPVAFLGGGGHGLVVTDRADITATSDPKEWRIRLAELAKDVPGPLQEFVLEDAELTIPAAEQERFRDEFYPQLRHAATIVSSDGSFTPPEISEPTLRLQAHHGAGHELELTWSWTYSSDASTLHLPLEPPASAGIRDPAAERSIVDSLDAGLERFGLATAAPAAGRTLLPRSRLTGIDTMRFCTEVLPLLSGTPGVVVETTGTEPDYREAGDAVRIGVSTDEIPGERDWFDLGVTITVEGSEVPFADLFAALAREESHLLLADGAFFSLEKPELQSLRRLIEEARALQDARSGDLTISRFQAGLWDELSTLGVVDRQAAAWREQLEGLLSPGSLEPPEPPAGLTARLRPYQREGYNWLSFLWRFRLGGVLADDMGLGKTLQTLTLISHAKQADPDLPPFLVVAPASVVSNWVTEARQFTPQLNVVPIGETLARRGESLAAAVDGADVVVTSYTLLRLDFDAYGDGSWSGLVLDEAQFAKNHQSKVHQCARRLPAPFKLAITGTPMENNLMELWSLLSITAPGLFPNPTRFRDYYARPIEKAGEQDLLARLRRRIKPLMLRRTKEQVVADLPAKQEQVLEVELHPRHRTIYQRHLQRERQKVLNLLADVDGNRFTILRSLTLLRQLSLHPALVDDAYAGVPCAKIDALFEQLREVVEGGHRALVFSQFTGFLAQAREQLDAAGIEYCYLDGKTRKRAEVIDGFKDGAAPVFLISLKAGGFGLNLTEADYCFLLDPWWNPATETQAVDRTHRIGQTRNVLVYRLIAADTIEQKVMALKQRKAELFSSVLEDGNLFGAGLDAEDIRALLD